MISDVVRLFIKDWDNYSFYKKYQTFLVVFFIVGIVYGIVITVTDKPPNAPVMAVILPSFALFLISYVTVVYYFGAACADKENKVPLISMLIGIFLILLSSIIIGLIIYYAGTGAANKKHPENDIWAPEETKK